MVVPPSGTRIVYREPPSRMNHVLQAAGLQEGRGSGSGVPPKAREHRSRRGLTKFVGRKAELEQMKRALDLATSGHGQIVAAMGGCRQVKPVLRVQDRQRRSATL